MQLALDQLSGGRADGIGYLPVNQTGAMLFFQLINRRYERASTVLTSNKGFEEWGDVLGDEVMAAALIDRLLHHCHIVNIRGNSYRMRHHNRALQSAPTRRLRSRALHPLARGGEHQRRRRRLRGPVTSPRCVTFSTATCVTFSTGVDSTPLRAETRSD